MKIKNYWGTDEDFGKDLEYTDNIYEIMDEQCKYLSQYTKGKVFAVFDEIKFDNPMLEVAQSISDVYEKFSGINNQQSSKKVIDANNMYFDKRYGFEVCTEKYRFRLFELRITPLYPIQISIDEGICKNIGEAISQIAIPMEKSNYFEISNEEIFCKVLQFILQDKKVRYIITKLKNQMETKLEKEFSEKVIICEGRTDEIILQAIARKLEQRVTIVTCEGKYNVPVIFNAVIENRTKSDILIVVDSDGDEEQTEKMLTKQIGNHKYELAIINNCIEDWFGGELANFNKLKLIQSIDTIIEEMDIDKVCKEHQSFEKVIKFLQK